MTLETQLTLWRAVLYFGVPLVILIGALIGGLANFKIESVKSGLDSIKSQKANQENVESEKRIRNDISQSATESNKNFDALSWKLDFIIDEHSKDDNGSNSKKRDILCKGHLSQEEISPIFLDARRLQLGANYDEALQILFNILKERDLPLLTIAVIKLEIAKD